MMMSRQQIHFPSLDAYHRGVALLAAVPVYVRNEKRRSLAAGSLSDERRQRLAELGATLREDGHHGADRILNPGCHDRDWAKEEQDEGSPGQEATKAMLSEMEALAARFRAISDNLVAREPTDKFVSDVPVATNCGIRCLWRRNDGGHATFVVKLNRAPSE